MNGNTSLADLHFEVTRVAFAKSGKFPRLMLDITLIQWPPYLFKCLSNSPVGIETIKFSYGSKDPPNPIFMAHEMIDQTSRHFVMENHDLNLKTW